MTTFGIVLIVGVPLLVLLVVLEGKRQARIYGRPSARPNLAGAGLLELQKHLQADRRVETLVEQVKDEAGETREDGSGEGPRTGRGARSGAPST
ncbi:MAG: hypothetical protein IPN03_22100 [Holophagales bacterium]|nr:hypothetical protein [Holophagales bacterium]